MPSQSRPERGIARQHTVFCIGSRCGKLVVAVVIASLVNGCSQPASSSNNTPSPDNQNPPDSGGVVLGDSITSDGGGGSDGTNSTAGSLFAADTSAVTVRETPVSVSLRADGDLASSASFNIVEPPSVGALGATESTGAGAASVPFTPGAGFVGVAQFSYQAIAGDVASNTATATITVNPLVRFAAEKVADSPLEVEAHAFIDGPGSFNGATLTWILDGDPQPPVAASDEVVAFEFPEAGEHSIALRVSWPGLADVDCYFGTSGTAREALFSGSGSPTADAVIAISGRVTTFGVALPGVTVQAGSLSDTTDSNGEFAFSMNSGWSGSVVPSKSGYTFAPASRSYSNQSTDDDDADFSATPTFSGDSHLSVSPDEGLSAGGLVAGSIQPASKTYTLTNDGSANLNWVASCSQTWMTITPASGTLAAGTSANVSVAFNSGTSALAAGAHDATVTFTNSTTGATSTRSIDLLLDVAPGEISLSPNTTFSSSGSKSDSFSPSSTVYTLTNSGSGALAWSALPDVAWLSVSPASGVLDPGDDVAITVSINVNAYALSAGVHSAAVEFSPGFPSTGETSRSVSLTVNASQTALAVNLRNANYYMPEWVFVDVFRQSSAGSALRISDSAPWTGDPISFRSDGYPAALPVGCRMQYLMCRDIEGHYPAGNYRLFYDGSGTISFSLDAAAGEYGNGDFVAVTPTNSGIALRLDATDPANPIRNIRLVMPGFDKSYVQNPFHPRFIELMRPFGVARFMMWQNVNGSDVTSWDERPQTTHKQNFVDKGVPVEWMIDLANALGIDPWFCMPHLADDDYMENFAALVRDRLDPARKCYIEYSNECWNYGGNFFPQYDFCRQQGVDLGYATAIGSTSNVLGYAHHSTRMFRIWSDVFGEPMLRSDRSSSRLVRVFAWQNTNVFYPDTYGLDLAPTALAGITTETCAEHADAYAVAPYFGIGGGETLVADAILADPSITFQDFALDGITVRTAQSITSVVDSDTLKINNADGSFIRGMRVQITSGPAAGQGRIIRWFDSVKSEAHFTASFSPAPVAGNTYDLVFSLLDDLEFSVDYCNDLNYDAANSRGLRLIAYEGGTHIEMESWHEDPDYAAVVAFHEDLHDSVGMYAVIQSYLSRWRQAGGTTFAYFHFAGWLEDSHFGLMRWFDEDPLNLKYESVADWADANAIWW